MVISEPADFDILCGKDKTYSKHRGNQLFRSKIMSMTDEYRKATSKPERMKLTRVIVDSLRMEYNSRFLRSVPVSGGGGDFWEEINDQQARDKTSHALRFALQKEVTITSRKKKKSYKNTTVGKYRRKSVGDFTSMHSMSSVAIKTISTVASFGPSVASDPETRIVKPDGGSQRNCNNLNDTTRYRHHHRRTGSDGSGGTLGTTTTDSDAVSTMSIVADAGDDDNNFDGEVVVVNARFVPEIEHTRHGSDKRKSDDQNHALNKYYCRFMMQGIQSSPARLGGGGNTHCTSPRRFDLRGLHVIDSFRAKQETVYNRNDDDDHDDQGNSSQSRWNIDQLDMTVRSDDLNDFLDEDISCDWNNDDDSNNDYNNDGDDGKVDNFGDESSDSVPDYRDLVEL